MKIYLRQFIILISIITIDMSRVQAQKGAETAAILAGSAFGIMKTAAEIDLFIETLEHEATEWILKNKPFLMEFELKLLNLRGESMVDISSISCCTFKVIPVGSEPLVLLWILDYGWYNANGLDITKVKIEVFNAKRWSAIFKTFLSVASGMTLNNLDSIPFYETMAGELKYAEKKLEKFKEKNVIPAHESHLALRKLNETSYALLGGYFQLKDVTDLRGGSVKGSIIENGSSKVVDFPLRRINGDTYLVGDIDNIRVVFNEKNVNLFFKDLGALVKIRRNVFEDISAFLLGIKG